MFLRMETLQPKQLAGKRATMSFAQNKTFELWRSFGPVRKTISNNTTDLYSLEIYPENFFEPFDPAREFEKWAAVEIKDVNQIPPGLETLLVPAGLYAVFLHKGPASAGADTYNYIFREWLPQSAYRLDQRPHFALMGRKYKGEDPSNEEEIWIPVQHR